MQCSISSTWTWTAVYITFVKNIFMKMAYLSLTILFLIINNIMNTFCNIVHIHVLINLRD